MSFHKTATGYVELICSWGHGRGSMPNTRRPATLTTDDGDGHYQQWKYTGRLGDALFTLARLDVARQNSGNVAVREGAGYHIEPAPEDFWIEDTDAGEWKPNLAAFPNVIAY